MKTGLCLIFHLYEFEQFDHLDEHTLMKSNNEIYSFGKILVNLLYNKSKRAYHKPLVTKACI